MEAVYKGELKMFSDEILKAILEKSKTSKEYLKCYDELMKWSQKAYDSGMTSEELSSIVFMGFMISSDPEMNSMVKNLMNISKIGLDIIQK